MRALMILLGASVLVRPVAGEEGKVDTVVVGPRPLVAEVTTDRPFYDLGDTVYILLKVHNFGHDEVKLTFPSSLQMDYVLDGAYRWSEGKVFLQVMTYVKVPPGGSHTWRLAHIPSEFPLKPGVHRVRAFLVGYRLEGTTWFVVGRSATLEGRVSDEEGKPVQGAVVSAGRTWLPPYLVKEDIPRPFPGTALTGRDGSFRIDGLAFGDTLKVRAWKLGYSKAETTVVVDEDTVRVELTLRRLKPVALTGKVLGEDGRPLEGAMVAAFGRSFPVLGVEVPPESFLPPLARTDEDGRFTIVGPFSGRKVWVSVRKEGYESVGRNVTVEGDTTRADFYLPKVDTALANRSGRVRDGIFFGLGADKFLYSSEDTIRARYRTMNTGVEPVRVPFPTGGKVEFVVLTPDGKEVWRWSEGKAFTEAESSLLLEPGRPHIFEAKVPVGDLKGEAFVLEAYLPSSDEGWVERSRIVLKFMVHPLPQAGAVLRGRVLGRDGPISGALVVVRPSALVLKGPTMPPSPNLCNERFVTFTDEEGTFQVEGLRRFGTYDVAAAAEGYWPEVKVVYAARETSYVELPLSPAEGATPVLRKVEGGICVVVDLPYPGEVKVEDVREELPKLEGYVILKLVRVRMDSALSVLSGRVKVTFPFDPRVLRKRMPWGSGSGTGADGGG